MAFNFIQHQAQKKRATQGFNIPSANAPSTSPSNPASPSYATPQTQPMPSFGNNPFENLLGKTQFFQGINAGMDQGLTHAQAASAARPNLGQQLGQLAMSDFGNQQQLQDFMNQVNQQFAGNYQNLGGQTSADMQALMGDAIGKGDSAAQGLRDLAGSQQGELEGFIDDRLGDFDKWAKDAQKSAAAGVATAKSAVNEFDADRVDFMSGRAYATARSTNASVEQYMSQAAAQGVPQGEIQANAMMMRLDGARNVQNDISQLQRQADMHRASLQMQVAQAQQNKGQLEGQLASASGSIGVSMAGQLRGGQAAQAAALQAAAGIEQGVRMNAAMNRMQAAQFEMLGMQAAQQSLQALSFVSALDTGVVMANLMKAFGDTDYLNFDKLAQNRNPMDFFGPGQRQGGVRPVMGPGGVQTDRRVLSGSRYRNQFQVT